jgi:hypothetical protein
MHTLTVPKASPNADLFLGPYFAADATIALSTEGSGNFNKSPLCGQHSLSDRSLTWGPERDAQGGPRKIVYTAAVWAGSREELFQINSELASCLSAGAGTIAIE